MPFTTVNNHKLHYTDSVTTEASSSTPTLIFVHGLGSTQNYFYPIFYSIHGKYRCIAFDNYGAGRSRLDPQDTEISIPSMAADVLGLMDVLSVDKAVVIGYSMGGMVLTHLAATSPHRITAGICIGPVHPTPAVAEVFKQRIPLVHDGGMEAMANTIPFAAMGRTATPLQKSFVREMIMAQEADGYIANCRAIQKASPPSYANVQCPMLIIAGDEDKSAPVSACKEIFEKLGTSQEQKEMKIMEGIGHWYCVESGDEVESYITAFLKQLH